LLLHAIVHPADIQDRDGGILLLAIVRNVSVLANAVRRRRLSGPQFHNALRTILPHLETQIVKRSDQKRLLNRYRRLAKDWENLNRKALTFLRLASIRLMLRKLCNPA
jgi:hypothetical protein